MMINKENYEAYLIDYLHGELNAQQQKEVGLFLSENPDVAEELQWLQQTIVTPEVEVVFEHKESLYKKEEVKVGMFIQSKRIFAVAAAVIGLLLAIYILMKKEKAPAYVNQKQQAMPVQSPIVNPPLKNDLLSEKKEKIHWEVATENHQNKKQNESKPEQIREDEWPIPETKQEEIVVKEDKPAEIIKPISPVIIKDTLPVYITKETQQPKQPFTPDEDKRVANRVASTRNVEWNEDKKPKLFRMINGLLGFTHKLKQKEEQLSNTQMTVMVGNKILFNINN
jgi:hypothetical protein